MSPAKNKNTTHPTARRILRAARRLLVTKGFEAVSFEAIAAACHVNKSATRYHFGSKSGLIEAMVEDLFDEYTSVTIDVSADMTDEERVSTFIANMRRLIMEVQQAGYFDLLPHVVRSKHLRERLVQGFEQWFDRNIEWLGLSDFDTPHLHSEVRAFGQLAAAVGDGLAVQREAYGRSYDPDPVLDLFRRLLAEHCERLKQAATSSSTGDKHVRAKLLADSEQEHVSHSETVAGGSR